MSLSNRQQKILQFIRRFLGERDFPPTIREIGEAVDISSTSVVNYNLNVLERRVSSRGTGTCREDCD